MSDNKLRIIIIDDNPSIHQDFLKILGADKPSDASSTLDNLSKKIFGTKVEEAILDEFVIDTASQGQEGVEKIKAALKEGHQYSLAFVDIRMPPGWDGIETIKHIWEVDKDVQIVICTAYSDYSWEETVANLGKSDNLLILKKPFDNVSVRQLTCALTKKWQLLQDTRKYTESLKKQVEARTISLQQSLSLVKATLESSNDGILVINNLGNIIDYNQRFIKMWQIPEFILNEKQTEKLQVYINGLLEIPNTLLTSSLHTDANSNIEVLKLKNGNIFECYAQPQLLNEESAGYVFSFHDITQRAKLENELHYQANHDALTGLPNRVLLLNRLKQSCKQAELNRSYVAVMFLDLDRFKLINDSLSHAVGDDLLKLVAKRLQSVMRAEDTLARLGGDEFVIVINSVANNNSVSSFANKVLTCFQQPFRLTNRDITITSSIGISIFPKDGITTDTLLRNADCAMYCAKEKGANNFQFYTPEMNNENLAKLDQEMQLRQAIINNELFLCYQPQVDIEESKLVAVEALIRWQHPQKGVLLPMDFVPLAEETGLIVPIGEWILRKACIQNKAWQDSGLPPIRIAVNVSAEQLKQFNFVDLVKSILEETKLDPAFLELELTENVIISNMEVIRTARALKELGVMIAIDDFGTGYSSLSYLKRLPLDRLKIDSSFIQHIQTKDDDEVLVRAIIGVANNLHLEVLAEGVETQNQLDFLKNNQCNEIQGYFYSKPLTGKELEDLLKADNLQESLQKIASVAEEN